MSEEAKHQKSQILAGATKLLTRYGIQALSFEAVAKETGLSRQLIRYYFKDLDSLVVALCDFCANTYRDLLVAGIVNIGEVERLDFFLDFFFGLAEGSPMPDNLEAYDSLLAYAVGSSAVQDRMCDQYRTLGHVIIHELAISYPELDGHACEELAYVFVSLMHAHWSFVATLKYAPDHGRLTRDAIDRLIASYVAEEERSKVIETPWARDS